MDMYEGRITAGNGIHLSRKLSEKETSVAELFSRDLADARKMNLTAVLYSSELLFNRFAEKDSFEKLCSAADTVGFGGIHALIYFRDPVSHALSTYKHRAKYGDHPDFKEWLQKEYEIYGLIQAFLKYSDDSRVQWSCRKYDRDSIYMVRSSFVDWLETETPEIPRDDRVNASLQLNEIRVLQSIKKKCPGCEDFLRESLLTVKTEEKESERGLKEEYTSLIAERWRDYELLLQALNAKMRESEKLTIQAVDTPKNKEPFVALSEKQLEAIAEGMTVYWDAQKLTSRIGDIWDRGLNKVRRKWTASRFYNNYPS
ncbi:hypothetical protein [Rhodohalobacter barkolensis]|nr:hypothetical protein [Rhodohalobacter barkolensis]